MAKEDVAQVWLADFSSTSNPPPVVYNQPTLEVYWGNPSATDKAALELTLVYYNGSTYLSRKWYLDNGSAVRNPTNGFKTVTCSGNYTLPGYQCYVRIGDQSSDPYYGTAGYGSLPASAPNRLILFRVRLLYNTTSQPFAVQPPSTATCGAACSLPPQARSIISTGVSGETQRKIKLFQLNKVVLPYFDYAIFSAGAISK